MVALCGLVVVSLQMAIFNSSYSVSNSFYTQEQKNSKQNSQKMCLPELWPRVERIIPTQCFYIIWHCTNEKNQSSIIALHYTIIVYHH